MTTIQVRRVYETTTGVARGVDAAVVVDGLEGEVTLAPAQYDGELRPYGADPSMWVARKLLGQLSDEQLSDLHDAIGVLVAEALLRDQ